MFALALGNTLVDENIGRFIVTQLSSTGSGSESTEIPIIPCAESDFWDLFTAYIKNAEALYCLTTYDDYKLKSGGGNKAGSNDDYRL